jgi:quinoprotein glucose dehydrogenase
VSHHLPNAVRDTARAGALVLTLAQAACVTRADATTPQDWPTYRRDLAGTGFSPLAEITTENVSQLERAWSYSLREEALGQARPRDPNSQATPIVVGDVMYVPGANRVVALNPITGDEIWRHQGAEGAPSRRGVAYWPGERGTSARVLFTAGTHLVALDASTGAAATGFGEHGVVDLGVPYNSVPMVYENIVVVGANTPAGAIGGVGNARAYDARTGEKIWEFSSVPQPGGVGHDTWAGDSWSGRLGVNAWPFYFTMDERLGLLYLPLASPIPGAYGGDRGGANLFGNSVVAVDVRTGAYVWHFQTIHHDLWDADPPAPPVLFDIQDGRHVRHALGVTTKSGYLYVLDRETGEPIFGVEERPVPSSDVPGELAFPTQPIPVKPPPMARVSYEPSDLVTADDTSPEHAAACAKLVQGLGQVSNDGPFTPWAYRPDGSPPRSTLVFPGLLGGPNWGGPAYDPRSGTIFVLSQDIGALGWVEAADPGSPVPYDRAGPRPNSFDVAMGDQRWPCQKPPWGRMIAVSAATGDVVWERPIGVTDELPEDRRNTGRPGRASAIVTGGGLLFVASTDDDRFRALDVATGRELWVTRLERRGNADPMTYLGADARQYVAIVATDEVVAFRLR